MLTCAVHRETEQLGLERHLCLSAKQPILKPHLSALTTGAGKRCETLAGSTQFCAARSPRWRQGCGVPSGDSPSSVMVPLLEPPLLLDCRWDDEEDTEDSAAWPLGEGEGVRVGDVLLEVAEVPDGGRLLGSSFCTGHKTNTEAITWWLGERDLGTRWYPLHIQLGR